ncbi:MAG: MarR family winged helix-turn-helix transcriptional regulator [Pseudobdellovibrio sp.]
MGKKTESVQYQDETKVHPELKNYMGYCLKKVTAHMHMLMNTALKKHDLQGYHMGVLKVIEVSGQISQIDLGEEMGIDKASMVKIIDHLEKKKCVERIASREDRRIKYIVVTKAGAKLLQNCHLLKTDVEKEFFRKLTPSEIETFKKIIHKLLP